MNQSENPSINMDNMKGLGYMPLSVHNHFKMLKYLLDV